MRVLVLMPLAEQRGGHELMLMELLRNANRAETTWRVTFLEDGPLVDQARSLGIAATVLPAGRLRHVNTFTRTVIAVSRLAGEVDAVLSWMAKAHLYGGPAAVIARKPAIWFQAGQPSRRAWMDRAVTLLPAVGVLTVSSSSDAAQRAIRPVRTTRLVYPGVDLERFKPEAVPDRGRARALLNLDQDAPIVGVVARLQRWKGIHLLIEALPRVHASFPNTTAVIVGGLHFSEPDYEQELRELAQRLGVAEKVVFAGLQRDVPSWISAMDVLAHPAYGEPFGLSIVEGMALGKPVVASDSGGPLEIIEDSTSGVLFRTGDASALAESLCQLLGDQQAAALIGQRARERAQSFSSIRFAEGVEDAIRTLASRERGVSPGSADATMPGIHRHAEPVSEETAPSSSDKQH